MSSAKSPVSVTSSLLYASARRMGEEMMVPTMNSSTNAAQRIAGIMQQRFTRCAASFMPFTWLHPAFRATATMQ